MRNATLLDALDAWVTRSPDAPALRDLERSLTRGQLADARGRAARRLVEAGLRPGDRVAVLGPLSIDWAVAALGVLRAGGVLCPLNERLSRDELDAVIGRLRPRFVVAAERHHAAVERPDLVAFVLESFDRFERDVPLPVRARDSSSVVCVLPTSGSTGQPKGVVYTHESMLGAFFEWALQAPELLRGRALNVSAMSFAAGLLNGFLGPLVFGGSVVLLPRWNPQTALELIRDERITTFAATTIFYEQIAALPAFAEADLSSLTVAFTGGSPVTAELIAAWEAKGVALRQAYGLTESLSNVTFPTAELAVENPESVGYGGILTTVVVTDEDGEPCAPGVPGEIRVSGPGVAPGYWEDEALSAETFADGWLRTGDIGVRDDDGALRVVGRSKDMIITGGMNVYSAEIERVALTLPGVVEVAVIGVPDEEFGETPALLLRVAEPTSAEDVLAHCRSSLAAYKVPRYVVFVDDALPRTASLKIDKPAIRLRYADIPTTRERHGRRPQPA